MYVLKFDPSFLDGYDCFRFGHLEVIHLLNDVVAVGDVGESTGTIWHRSQHVSNHKAGKHDGVEGNQHLLEVAPFLRHGLRPPPEDERFGAEHYEHVTTLRKPKLQRLLPEHGVTRFQLVDIAMKVVLSPTHGRDKPDIFHHHCSLLRRSLDSFRTLAFFIPQDRCKSHRTGDPQQWHGRQDHQGNPPADDECYDDGCHHESDGGQHPRPRVGKHLTGLGCIDGQTLRQIAGGVVVMPSRTVAEKLVVKFFSQPQRQILARGKDGVELDELSHPRGRRHDEKPDANVRSAVFIPRMYLLVGTTKRRTGYPDITGCDFSKRSIGGKRYTAPAVSLLHAARLTVVGRIEQESNGISARVVNRFKFTCGNRHTVSLQGCAFMYACRGRVSPQCCREK
eukprot:m.962323 g.962323  ORF g.962323 m.962323 type:complete len:394 (+) comp23889_c0_seq4:1158-2339(+)